MSEEQYTTEKSALRKKQQWRGALGGHQHHQEDAQFFLSQTQNLQQTQQSYVPNLAGGSLDSATFQPVAGISCENSLFENPDAIVDVRSARHACRANASADGSMHCDDADVGSAHVPSAFAPGESARKSSISLATGRRQAESVRDNADRTGQSSLSMSMPIKVPTPRRTKTASVPSLTVRPTGTKDRHSKVRTAKGLRDRRVRLSAPTAIQFFDVQDRLGYDQPSKAVDWLIRKARAAIDELAPVEAVVAGDETPGVAAREGKVRKDNHVGSLAKVKNEEQAMTMSSVGGVRAESRVKARERARERAKEKTITSGPISSPAAISGHEVTAASAATTTPVQPFMPSATSNSHLSLSELFLLSSQLRQPFDNPHRSTDLSSMLSQPSSTSFAPQFLPVPSHFLSCPPQSSSVSAYVHPGMDVPLSFQFSAAPIHTNLPISPRGTLQSIFSNPASFSMQPHMPLAPHSMSMLGAMQQAHLYDSAFNSVEEDRQDNDEEVRQSSAELGSPELHQHARIPMRIHGMEMDSHVEESRITSTSMQADFQ